MDTKKCKQCQLEKNINEFHKKIDTKDGLQLWCKSCYSERSKNYYILNKDKLKKEIVSRTKARKKICVKILQEIKRKYKCALCEEKDSDCMDFHHLFDKKINISDIVNANWSWIRVKAELEKCVLLCANCHRKVHAGTKEVSTNMLIETGVMFEPYIS